MGKVVIAIIIILLILGAYYLFKDDTPSIDTNQNNEEEVTVTYTDGGFSPQTIMINNGERVTFVNQSSGTMWVASAPHPTHTDYPEFDQKESVSSGQSWSFVFGSEGTWRYHNHVNASSTGTVVVQ